MIMSLLWENRWFEKEIISVLRLTRKWSSQSISKSEVFFRHFWRFELGTIIISRLFLDFSNMIKYSGTFYQPFHAWFSYRHAYIQESWFETCILASVFQTKQNHLFWTYLKLIDCELSNQKVDIYSELPANFRSSFESKFRPRMRHKSRIEP